MSDEGTKRLRKEIRDFMVNPRPGLSASLPDESNVHKWHALIYGPKETPFEGGTFRVEMIFPKNYPASASKVTFLSKMFHPNVYRNGNVCMDFLCGKWRSSFQAADILNTILVLLGDPNVNSPANQVASDMYKRDPNDPEYIKNVKSIVDLSETNHPKDGVAALKNYNI